MKIRHQPTLTMGNWTRANGHTWILHNQERTLAAIVTLTRGGWRWTIVNDRGPIVGGKNPARRSRKARRQAQAMLAQTHRDHRSFGKSYRWSRTS